MTRFQLSTVARRPLGESARLGVRAALSRMGYTLSRNSTTYTDMGPEFWEIHEVCRDLTRTPTERMYALYEATNYIVRAGIPGAIVESGVWRGGSIMLAALALKGAGDVTRDLYLLDTFKGLPAPGPQDRSDMHGEDIHRQWARWNDSGINTWAYAPLDDVHANMARTGYPSHKIHYVEGMVQETVPAAAPGEIALLRLDTDWYESTKHELEHLYPRLVPGGVLIVDDVGEFSGAKQAFNEFLQDHPNVFVNRIDYTGRLVVKPLN